MVLKREDFDLLTTEIDFLLSLTHLEHSVTELTDLRDLFGSLL